MKYLDTVLPDVLLQAVKDSVAVPDYAARLTMGLRPYGEVFEIFAKFISGESTMEASVMKLCDGAPEVELLDDSAKRFSFIDPRIYPEIDEKYPWIVHWKVRT